MVACLPLFGTPDQGVLRAAADSRQVADTLVTRFPGNAGAPIDVVTAGPVGSEALGGYARQLSLLPEVAQVSTSVGTYRQGQASPATAADAALSGPHGQRLTVVTTLAAKSDQSQELVGSIRGMPGPADWLGVTPRPMDMSMTVLLFCIAFGLSMDYEVFVLSRIKELHDEGMPSAQSVPEGLARTGRIVSTAAGLLAVSFVALGTSTVSFLQMFGIGTGLAILIDATLIRGVLVPAAMRVLGPAAWYSPAPLRRRYARVALNEG